MRALLLLIIGPSTAFKLRPTVWSEFGEMEEATPATMALGAVTVAALCTSAAGALPHEVVYERTRLTPK